MAKLSVVNPQNEKTTTVEVTDDELSSTVQALEAKGRIVIDLDSGQILSRAAQPYSATGSAWEGLKSGVSMGLADEYAGLEGKSLAEQSALTEQERNAQAEAERQNPLAYAGGKFVGEVGRDMGAQALALFGLRSPALARAAPIVTGAISGAGEGETPLGRLAGGAVGGASGLVGGALGRAAAAPAAAIGRLAKKGIEKIAPKGIVEAGRRLLGATESAPQTGALQDYAEKLAAARTAKGAIGEAGEIPGKITALEQRQARVKGMFEPLEKRRVDAKLKGESLSPEEMAERDRLGDAMAEIDGELQVLRSRAEQLGLEADADQALESITSGANLAAAEARAARMPAAKEALIGAAVPAAVRAAGEIAMPPPRSRRQTAPGASYGEDWAAQLAAAGLSPEMIAKIEAGIARLPGEGPGGVSPLLRLQRPVIPTDEQLAGLPPDAQQQLARGALQSLGEYYNRTKDAAVVPEMQRLGKFVGGM